MQHALDACAELCIDKGRYECVHVTVRYTKRPAVNLLAETSGNMNAAN
jgi:hypothetical protein